MTCGIYRITYNDKIAYIGSSINVERRWSQHKNNLRKNKHHNFLLQRAWDKYNPDVFKFELLEECSIDELQTKEQFYIDTNKPLFNIADANGSHKHTEETKKKMKGRIVSNETRLKLSQSHKGKPSGRKGIKTGFVPSSAFKKGQVPWNKGKKLLKPSWNAGKHLSSAHKKKLSEAHKNKQPTEAQLIYWESLKGKKMSSETKKKISNSVKITKNKGR